MLALEEVEGDRVGVVGLDELEAFGFELVAGAFDHELGFAGAVQGAFEVVVVLLWPFAAGVVGVEVGLDAQPGLGVDEGFVGALVGDAAEGDGALVVGVGQDLVQPGRGDWFGRLRGGGSGGQAAGCEFFGQARQGPVPGGVGGERETDEVGAFGVDLDLAGLASSGIGGADVEVAQRRFGGGASSR